LRFLTRHPLLILFVIGVIGLSYAAWNKIQNPVAGPGAGPFAGAGGPGRGGPGARGGAAVAVEMVRRQIIADQIESVGTTTANESLNLTAKVSDTISRIHFNDGDFVRQGDILVELTNASEATRLTEARAAAADARRQYDRLRSLGAANLIAPTDIDEARTRAETAEARLEGVMVAMDDRLIRAPFSGVLGFRNVSEGSLLTPSTVITTLDDISVIKLDFTIAELYLAAVQAGQPIKARSIVYRDHEFEGEVRVVGSRIDPVTRSVSVRAHIDNPEGMLRPGMLLTVALGLNAYEATVIPEQAVVPSQGRQYVFVVDEESIAQRVEVELGRRRPGLVEVIAGVQPGQRVVTQGLGQMRPGMPVRILNQPLTELAAPKRNPDVSAAEVAQTQS
jgi:membrane fusion protein, multidrug efflux system